MSTALRRRSPCARPPLAYGLPAPGAGVDHYKLDPLEAMPRTVQDLVCGAIVTPMEGAYGNQRKTPWTVLLAGRDPQAVFAKDGLFDELKKALAGAF